MTRVKYLNIDTAYYTSRSLFGEYYVELAENIREIKSLSVASIELPMIQYRCLDISNNNGLSDLLNARYLYLEIIEYDYNKHNNYLFLSSALGYQISKYIIARIVLDYKTFPIGSILPANLINGLLISTVRTYKKPICLENMKIRLINELGVPVFLEGLDFSFCIQLECEDSA
jgi:hypothetical protein